MHAPDATFPAIGIRQLTDFQALGVQANVFQWLEGGALSQPRRPEASGRPPVPMAGIPFPMIGNFILVEISTESALLGCEAGFPYNNYIWQHNVGNQMTRGLKFRLVTVLLLPFLLSMPCFSATHTNIPNKSLIVIDGGGGCLAYEHYNYTILHHGTNVIAKTQTGFEKKLCYFKLPYENYISLLQKYFELKETLKDGYGFGDLRSTGDWHMSLTIEYANDSEVISKEVGYILGRVEDEHFLSLLEQISSIGTIMTECASFEYVAWSKARPTDGWSFPGETPVESVEFIPR